MTPDFGRSMVIKNKSRDVHREITDGRLFLYFYKRKRFLKKKKIS